jgi:hypothetical protein
VLYIVGLGRGISRCLGSVCYYIVIVNDGSIEGFFGNNGESVRRTIIHLIVFNVLREDRLTERYHPVKRNGVHNS